MVATSPETPEFTELRVRHRGQLADAGIRVLRSPVGAACSAVIVILALAALLAPVAAPASPRTISSDVLIAPSFDSISPADIGDGFGLNLMGTDHLGRDVLSRMMHGARASLYVGFLVVFFGTLVGTVIGLVSGLLGGWIDLTIQRFVDALLAFPAILLVMAIVSVLQPSTTNAVLSIAVVVAASNSRVVRGAVISVKNNVYIEAAVATGAGQLRIMLQHILPNVAAPILILISAGFGAAILIEGALSFLGLATQPPDTSWGVILRDGRDRIETSPWPALFAGGAIATTVLSFNLLGDVIRDVLDPRLRGTR